MFACTRKERQISRAGTPYLTIELRDNTGTILARAFRDADVLAGRFERGELVRVHGRVERFREELQIEVRSDRSRGGRGRRPRALPARRLPRPRRARRLPRAPRARGLRPRAEDRCSRACSATASCARRFAARPARCREPLEQPARRARPPGAARPPITPTSAACWSTPSRSATMALELCVLHPRLDRDLLLSAAIVHDLGKTREFTYGAEIAHSTEGRLLGHVELGLRLIAQLCAAGAGGRAPARAGALRDPPSRRRRGGAASASARPRRLRCIG